MAYCPPAACATPYAASACAPTFAAGCAPTFAPACAPTFAPGYGAFPPPFPPRLSFFQKLRLKRAAKKASRFPPLPFLGGGHVGAVGYPAAAAYPYPSAIGTCAPTACAPAYGAGACGPCF